MDEFVRNYLSPAYNQERAQPSAPPLPEEDDLPSATLPQWRDENWKTQLEMQQNSQNGFVRLPAFSDPGSRRISNSTAVVFVPQVTPPPDAVDDDPDPSAPPLEQMDAVQGYESVSFESVEIPPPLVPVLQRSEEEEPERAPLAIIPHLTEKEVRQALMKEISSHCCYGSSAARDMAVTDIKHSIAFHYTLETFTEKRMTCWTYVPYTGETIDSPESGPAPFPWDIPVVPPKRFQNQVSQTEVPHTASVKTCHVCGGIGRKRCTTCSGNGWEYCYSCHGDGHKPTSFQGDHDRCFQCHGTGRRKCWKCNGDGMASCKCCAGTGQIKCFIRLTVVWTNHLDDYVVDKAAAIQGERLKAVTGEVVFEEDQSSVRPLNHFPDNTVNMASVQLIQQHASCFSGEKVLRQRHRVSIIPIAAVSYKWKNHDGLYQVYGYEQKVYAPDYPQTCCCCCIS